MVSGYLHTLNHVFIFNIEVPSQSEINYRSGDILTRSGKSKKIHLERFLWTAYIDPQVFA